MADMELAAQVVGKVPSGVFILTAGDGAGAETGMLASWVQQASFEPLQLTVAVNQSRYLNQWIAEGSIVGLNLVGENGGSLLKHFGKGFEPDQSAFDGVDMSKTEAGSIVLADAVGHLAAKVVSKLTTGDHEIYLVEVVDGVQSDLFADTKPMVHIRKSGSHY